MENTSPLQTVGGNAVEGQDYWYYEKSGYVPYKYPHPLQEENPEFPPMWNISGGMSESEPHHDSAYNLSIEKGHNTTTANTRALLSVRWTDSSGLSHYIIEHNNTGTLVNESITAFGDSPKSGWSNATITLNETVGNIIAWRTYANGSAWVMTSWQYIDITEGEYEEEGWTGIIIGVTNPAKINGVLVASIVKVMR